MPAVSARQGQALRFGRYEALFRIASGGMAEVFAARIRGEAGFEKLVAVKRMLPHLAEDDEFVQMFLDEARVAAHIVSPHVVQTLDLGRGDDGAPYIVMELVVGMPLTSLVRAESAIPLDIALELLAQAARGLDDAHEATTGTGQRLEVVHRDMSPQNILVGADGRVRVADFGIARAMLRMTQTTPGQMKGKFAYFSPEQAVDERLDRRSDVFSLGTVAWELLTRERLFADPDAVETLHRVCALEIPRPKGVPAAVGDVVAKALERDRARRYQSAAELEAALRAVARDLGMERAPRDIARYVADAHIDRLVQLQDRIRAALAEPEMETLPDLDLDGAESEASTVAYDRSSTRILDAFEEDFVAGTATAAPSDSDRPAKIHRAADDSRFWTWVGAIAAMAIAVGGAVLVWAQLQQTPHAGETLEGEAGVVVGGEQASANAVPSADASVARVANETAQTIADAGARVPAATSAETGAVTHSRRSRRHRAARTGSEETAPAGSGLLGMDAFEEHVPRGRAPHRAPQ